MYEKLDKLRAELDKARMKRAEADAKVKHLEQKLREAENSQILAEVGALKLTPEQLAEFLKMAAGNRMATVSQPSPFVANSNDEEDYESEVVEDEEE